MRANACGLVIGAAILVSGCSTVPELTSELTTELTTGLGLGTPTDGPLPAANIGLIGLTERESAWTRYLPELLPAIRGCAAEIKGEAQVVNGWPMHDGVVGVRFATRDGARVDCTAVAGSGAVERLDAVPGDEKLPGEGELVLRLGAEKPEERWCKATDRVLDGRGETVGWLSRDVCWNLL